MNYDTYQDASDELALELYQEEQAKMDELYDERVAEAAWQSLEAHTQGAQA
jgi:hypothetical protein